MNSSEKNKEIRKKKKNFTNVISKVLIVFGSFIIYFIADGTSLSFGIHIREIKEYFQTSTTLSSVTGSLLQSIPLFLSPFVCILIEKYGCRVIAFCGATIFTASFIITRFFVTDLISLYLTLGFLASCGLAMCYIPAYLILSFHFDKKRATAIGIAVSGSGLGVFAIPPILEYLITEYGWLNACFIFAAICSHMFISACLYRPVSNTENDQQVSVTNVVQNVENEKSCFGQTFILLKILFTNKRYLVIILAYTILSFLITAPYNFLPDYINMNSINDTSSISISFIGISTVVGQIFIGVISDKFVTFNWLIYSICLILAGFSTCILPLCKHLYLICIYSVFYGFTTSVNYVLQSNLVIEAVGIENLTLAFGCLQACQGVSTLLGTPAAAWLADITGDYNMTFFISGIFISISGFSLLLWPLASRKKIEINEN